MFDLHIHSEYSDGSLSVDEICAVAKLEGLRGIVVTDHDSIDMSHRSAGIVREAGLETLPGVEFSCYDNDRKRLVHILAYGAEATPELQMLCRDMQRRRNEAGLTMLDAIARDYPISKTLVFKYAAWSGAMHKQHIMRAMMEQGLRSEIYGPTFSEFFSWNTGKYYVKVEYNDVYVVLDAIRSAGGVSVLAHPGEYNSLELLAELARDGKLDGVEAYHPRNKESDTEYALAIAREHNLIVTGGSDFHGLYNKKLTPLGCRRTSADEFQRLTETRDRYAAR